MRKLMAVAVAGLMVCSLLHAEEQKPSPAAAGSTSSVMVAITGDIAGKSTCKAVSDAILAEASVKAVLLVGDTCNMTPAPLDKYEETYKDTFDRFKDRLYPAPGNHDKLSSPPFSAYSAFWKAAAHAPEKYYSFELGGWHVVSLDSVTFNDDKAAAAKQLEWLKKDLAAHPAAPVIAYWHYPFFSSAKHCGDHHMKPLWTAIYEHGPALVFAGHNHVYERFEPMDPEGQKSPPTKGIQEFVIGPGGANPTKAQKADAKPPLPAVFHGDAQHVGFFTLSPDGQYRFVIKAIAKDGKTVEVDSGSGSLK